jgi:septum formation protein
MITKEKDFMQRCLWLGSNSVARQRLLKEARIPFVIIGHEADESACHVVGASLQSLVESIALSKMEHVCLDAIPTSEHECFILTADTMCQTRDGVVQGKPIDRADAIAKIKASRGGACVATAFCLDRRERVDGQWRVVQRIQKCMTTDYVFTVPDQWIEKIFEVEPMVLQVAGAIFVEEFGDQFLQEVHGSYSNIVGLPMYELRRALEEIDFYTWIEDGV